MTAPYVIVGAGQAGAWVAMTLRAEGYEGPLVMMGVEAHPPYERPPLSKSVLVSGPGAGHAPLLSVEQAAELAIELRLQEQVTAIDRDGKELKTASRRSFSYDKLFLTTGSRARLPDWYQPSNRVHQLRSLDDAYRLHAAVQGAKRVLVLGGGWVGLEAAASLRGLGVSVVVIEAAARVCARSVPPAVSSWLAALHRAEGVELRTGVAAAGLEERGEGLSLTLQDGSVLTGDHLLIGIGNIPETGLAEAAGLSVDNGIVVDAACRTADPAIFAAGDVANFPCRFAGGRARRESWANAQAQAAIAAHAALGREVHYDDVPWLWSDQYGRNIQIVGVPEGASTVLASGTPDGPCWLSLNAGGVPVGAVTVNAPKILRPLRNALQNGAPIDLSSWVPA